MTNPADRIKLLNLALDTQMLGKAPEMYSIRTATEVMMELREQNMSKETKKRLKSQTVYILVKVDGYTYRETAKILGFKSPSTVDYWLKRWEDIAMPWESDSLRYNPKTND